MGCEEESGSATEQIRFGRRFSGISAYDLEPLRSSPRFDLATPPGCSATSFRLLSNQRPPPESSDPRSRAGGRSVHAFASSSARGLADLKISAPVLLGSPAMTLHP